MTTQRSLQQETVSVATYNCLANEYLNYWEGKLSYEQIAYKSQPQFDRLKQIDIVARLSKLNADVVCLQELSAQNVHSFVTQMDQLGYRGSYEQFGDGFQSKPDGIAIFYKKNKFTEARQEVLPYQDGTGRKALFLHLKTAQGVVTHICNTHLQGGDRNRHIANQQIQKLIAKVNQIGNNVIVCGDFNFTPSDSRFYEMSKSLTDVLNGSPISTSMNGTTPLRLDYIWHTPSQFPLSASVNGNLQKFMTKEEPSDHIPMIASFGFDVPIASPDQQGLNIRNPFQGSDSLSSFEKTIFDSFNHYTNWLALSQTAYDKYSAILEKEIHNADAFQRQGKGQFLDELYREIVFNAENIGEVILLCGSFAQVLPSSNISLYNDQPYVNTPSFRWTLFDRFNQVFLSQLGKFPGVYAALAPYFSQLLTNADQIKKTQGGDYLSHLANQIDHLPVGHAKNLFLEVISTYRPAAETVITVKCKDVPNDQELFIRGSGAGLSWTQGIPLKRIDWQTWEFRTANPIQGELEYKFLVGDDNSKWEEGTNHKITQGKKEEVLAAFNSSCLPPLQKTVIEVNFPVPTGKTLALSGNGPLGNWDRKVPLKYLGNNKWFLSFDGRLPSFEYKFRLDDNWENGNNHQLECGKVEQIPSLQF
jgi:endonuclease/exonuclease/phosphatase family metal-dependent hydrolase